jgi:hypothetical protein
MSMLLVLLALLWTATPSGAGPDRLDLRGAVGVDRAVTGLVPSVRVQ